MTSDASRLQRTLALFEAVADLPAEARKRHLDEACAGDAALRAAVEAMLVADRTADSLPTEPAAWLDDSAPPPVDEDEDLSALRFGPWQVTGVLGRGGMGAVYRVERADGAYHQTAALKRIRDDAMRMIEGVPREINFCVERFEQIHPIIKIRAVMRYLVTEPALF